MTIFGSFFDDCTAEAKSSQTANAKKTSSKKMKGTDIDHDMQSPVESDDEDTCNGISSSAGKGSKPKGSKPKGSKSKEGKSKEGKSKENIKTADGKSKQTELDSGKKNLDRVNDYAIDRGDESSAKKGGVRKKDPSKKEGIIKVKGAKKRQRGSDDDSDAVSASDNDDIPAPKKSKIAADGRKNQGSKVSKDSDVSKGKRKLQRTVSKQLVPKSSVTQAEKRIMKLDNDTLSTRANAIACRVHECDKLVVRNRGILGQLNKELNRRGLVVVEPGSWCEGDKKKQQRLDDSSQNHPAKETVENGGGCEQSDDSMHSVDLCMEASVASTDNGQNAVGKGVNEGDEVSSEGDASSEDEDGSEDQHDESGVKNPNGNVVRADGACSPKKGQKNTSTLKKNICKKKSSRSSSSSSEDSSGSDGSVSD